jgi:Ala-tRNA(Pro) deacylase
MSVNELEAIKNKFVELGLHPIYLEHEAVLTSEQAAKARGTQLNQGIKALVVTDGNNQWAVIDLPANRKANTKSAAIALGWSKKEIRMATPEEVLEITGCELGAVPPFGHKKPIKILADKMIFENNENAFNIGLRTNSVKIPTSEIYQVFKNLNALEGDFSKE